MLPRRTPRDALEGQRDDPIVEQLETLATLHPVVVVSAAGRARRYAHRSPAIPSARSAAQTERPLLLRPVEDMFEIQTRIGRDEQVARLTLMPQRPQPTVAAAMPRQDRVVHGLVVHHHRRQRSAPENDVGLG